MMKKHARKSRCIFGLIIMVALALFLLPPQTWAGPDRDKDGFDRNADCNDNDGAVYPGAMEICDGIDNQCPGDSGYGQVDEGGVCGVGCTDADGDGHCSDGSPPDCNDFNSAVYPGATEICDGIDNQCAAGETGYGQVDEGFDQDGDNFTTCAGDCDDSSIAVNPDADEVCGDGLDNDCSGGDAVCGGGALDTDLDGFPDDYEQPPVAPFGITLPAGMILAADGSNFLPTCTSGADRSLCVDPLTPDIFVIVDRATGCPATTSCGAGSGITCAPLFTTTNISMPPYAGTYNPLEFIPRTLSVGGLEVAVHEVIQTSGSTQAIGPHFAARVVEDLDPCYPYMGLATFGTLDAGSVATVWTEKIRNWVANVCSEACFTDKNGNTECFQPGDGKSASFVCKNASSGGAVINLPGQLLDPLVYDMIRNVFNHEVSHLIHLADGPDTSGHHYAIAAGVVMEQIIDVKATKTGNKNNPTISVILYISEQYKAESQAGYQLAAP